MLNNQPSLINQKRLVKLFKDIKRLKSDETRFCFLIGAGASKSSEIPTGWELSKEWYKDLKDDLDSEELKNWEEKIEFDEKNIGAYYPYLYKKRYEASPQVGYEEFKKLMENVVPNIGYVILSQILTTEKHNFVITTNFDYLIEDSVRMYTSKKPFSAGHETLAEFISSQTERPTIIKVHRDLFLHPFNDENETQKLKDEWKKALTPILRNFNLLVIGYGGNDGSLMDYLSSIEAQNRKALYWCIRNENELNNKINKLLEGKDFIAKINGFDELMISLNDALGYKVFESLDEPEKHPFVLAAKNRITDLNGKLKTLLDKISKYKNEITEGTKEIFTGAMKYVYDAYTEKDENKSNEIFQKGIAEYPKDHMLLGYYASFLADIRKDYDKAEEYYKKTIELKPDDADFIGNYALFLSDIRKDYDKAEKYYKIAIGLKPDDADFIGNYANFLKKIRKDYDKAEEYYKRAIGLKPDDADFIGNYANFLSDTHKDYNKAEEYYKKAIGLDPSSANKISNYANFLTNIRKNFNEAEEYHKKAIGLKPDDANFIGNYAHYLIISKRDFINAEKYLDKAFKLVGINELNLLSELWFYRYAHYKKWFEKGEKELEKLTSTGAKSFGWDMESHIEISKSNNHPNIKKLQEFSDLITK